MLNREGQLVYQQCQRKAEQATTEAVQKLDVVIRGTERRLPEVVRTFTEPFKEEDLPGYQQKLCDFIDVKLISVLEDERARSLDKAHENIKTYITSKLSNQFMP